MKKKSVIEPHEFNPRWDEQEKGYYCTVCGVLKGEEHRQFEISPEPEKHA